MIPNEITISYPFRVAIDDAFKEQIKEQFPNDRLFIQHYYRDMVKDSKTRGCVITDLVGIIEP